MQTNLIPFNLDLLYIDDKAAKMMHPVTALDIMLGSSRNFHPEGLFSTEIFGKIGDDRRNQTYSYIDLKVEILHPLIYKVLSDLKGLYADILQSKAFAVWDDSIKDFVASTPTAGKTGYSFFIEHFKDIKHAQNESPKREFNIKLMEKYKEKALMNKLLVMPAGLRDFEFDPTGKPSEDEINTYYRKVLNLANIVDTSKKQYNTEAYDTIRAGLQLKVEELYEYIIGLLEGKHKLVLGKWATRRIQNGTRNVLTALNTHVDQLNSPLTVSTNETVVGLFQYLKATLPVAIYLLRSGFLASVFTGPNTPAVLVNKKTLKKEMAEISPEHFDYWMTSEGLEKMINEFGEEDLRHEPLIVEGRYLGLIYKGDGVYKLFNGIDELPENLDKDKVFPITFAELLYLSVYKKVKDMAGFFTRYPIANYGSIYPTKIFLKSTEPGEIREELGPNWADKTGDIAYQFPVKDGQFINSMSPAMEHLKRLGADFDGDTGSLNIVYTDEAQKEIMKTMNSRQYYVTIDGKMNFSASTDIINYTLQNMTGE